MNSPIVKFTILTLLVGIVNLSNGQGKQSAKNMEGKQVETITLGAGCFWCVEAIFGRIDGVVKVESGYSGGTVKNPTYKEVCTGNTSHAEVVQVTFDPQRVSLEKILEVYFKTHDPTTLNRQGADIGTQYRSVIFYHTDRQKAVAEEIKLSLDKAAIWNAPIVTTIEPFKAFYKAEDYHQDYYSNNKNQPYCRMVIAPKLEKFEKVFGKTIKE